MSRRIEKMTGRDWLWPLIFLALGAGGAFAAHHYFFQAFPEASVNLKLTRQEVEQRAVDFLRGRGLNIDGYHLFTAFSFDEQGKTYLERELGNEEANRLMSGPVRIWNWRTRVIKPPEIEEMSVQFTTTGELMGFEHKIKEKDPGALLTKAEAQRVAEVFLRTERRIDLAKYHLVEDVLKTRPNRLDYVLTFEENDFKAKDATHRITITVQGDRVGGMKEFLKVPDKWERDYKLLRSRNDLLEVIATSLYVLLVLVGVFLIFTGGRIKKIRWKTMLAIGGVLGFLIMASTLNQIPLALQSMPTSLSYGAMELTIVFGAVLGGVGAAIYVMLLTASGEPLYRQLLPNCVSLDHLFTTAGLRTKEFFRSTLIGYGMAGMHIGLVVLFYMVAMRAGAWAPMDVNYDNTVSTPLPWLSPLAMASFAASTEEFGFRLFAIPLILMATRRWFKTRWLAVLVPAFLWGFLHSSYPQQPAWIRGVEVGLIGVVAGWVFLNFGILATLVWHYTVDAVLMGMFLLRSDNLTFRIAGALVGDAVLIPLIISVVFYLEARGFVSDTTILNEPHGEAEPKELAETATFVPSEAEPPALPFQFITPVTMRLLVGAAVVALIASVALSKKHEDRRITVSATHDQAESAAADFLKQKGVAVDSWRRVTALQNAIRGNEFDYLVEKSDPERATAIYRQQIPSVHWRTRFFKELQKEEYVVLTGIDGKVDRYVHRLAEDAVGARLENGAATNLATSAVLRSGIRLDDYTLIDHTLTKRPNRDDYEVIFESKQKLAGEATHRLTVDVLGDEVNGPRHSVKIPEDWLRKREERGIRQIAVVVLIVLGGLLAVILAALAIPKIAVYWRLHLTLGGIAAAIRLAASFNDFPNWLETYDTAIPWSTNVTQNALSGAMQIMLAFVGVAAIGVMAEVLLRSRFGEVSFWPQAGADRARAMLEGLFAGLSAVLIVAGGARVISFLVDKIPSTVTGSAPSVAGYPQALLPGLAVVLSSFTLGIWMTLGGGAALGTLLRVCKNPELRWLAIVATIAVLAGASAFDGMLFVKHFISMLTMAALWYGLVSVLRFNAFSYAVMGLALSSAEVLSMWVNPGLHPYAVQAAIGLGVAAVAYIAWIQRELNA